MAETTMESDLMKWLDMVWNALEEPDDSKRVQLLDDANCFLEKKRQSAEPELTFTHPSVHSSVRAT